MSPSYVDFIYILIDDALLFRLCCKFWRRQMGWWRKQNPLSCKTKLTIFRSDFSAVLLIVYKYSCVNIKTRGRMAVSVLHESYSVCREFSKSANVQGFKPWLRISEGAQEIFLFTESQQMCIALYCKHMDNRGKHQRRTISNAKAFQKWLMLSYRGQAVFTIC